MPKQSQELYENSQNTTIQSLIDALHNRDGLARQATRNSLVAIGPPAVPFLIRALDSDNKDIRWEATKGLEEIGDPSAAEALVWKLDHDHFAIRWLAAEGLIGFGMAGLNPLFAALLRDPDSAFLRDGAHHVLQALCDKGSSLHSVLLPLVDALGSLSGPREIVPYVHMAMNALSDMNDA